MAYTVFFREGRNIFQADSYIEREPEHFRRELKQIAGLLSSNGFVEGYRAVKLANGDWSVWLQDPQGQLTNYSLFISSFESTDTQDQDRAVVGKAPLKKRELVIISGISPRDSAGGFHPGYWSIPYYAGFFEPSQQRYFMETIAEILAGIPSENYTIHSDKEIAIHIHKPEGAYSINIQCTAMWV
jgi:hypothetical protein